MQISLLDAKHPTYDAKTWGEYDALYRGGKAFRHCIGEFLRQNPAEPGPTYDARKHEARYVNYSGHIVDFYAGKLTTSPPVVRAKSVATGTDVEPDAFYAAWKEDVDGGGTDLVDFVRERFVSASVKGRSWWLVEMPDDDDRPAANLAEWEERGLGMARLCSLENEQVLDWETDETGRLEWAIVYHSESRRSRPTDSRSRIREVWRIYDREYVETFSATHDPEKEQRPENAASEGRRRHGFSSVPLVMLGFVGTRGLRVKLSHGERDMFGLHIGPRYAYLTAGALEGFWLMNRLAEPQIAHFRMGAALDWNIKRTCYAMPVFSLQDPSVDPPVMGAGYGIKLGKDETVTWAAPPTSHLATVADRVAALKDEIYRIANQLAQGVDNNAAAVGRSADSKASDAAATDVTLQVYGALCREPIERTYELISDGRRERDLAWSIEGLDSFNVIDAASVLANALDAQGLDIPSPTWRREVMARAAEATLPGVDQATKNAIRKEIADGIAAEQTMRDVMAKTPLAADEPDGDEAPEGDDTPDAAE